MLVQRLLDYVWVRRCLIVPTGASPFKEGLGTNQPYAVRLRWVEKAFEGIERVSVLKLESPYRDEEGRMRSVFYTNETLDRFYRLYGYYPYLGIGSDALASLHHWKDWQKLLEKTQVVVFGRSAGLAPPHNEEWASTYRQRIHFLDTPLCDISSTEIRNRATLGKSLRGFVPASIETEIEEAYREGALREPGL